MRYLDYRYLERFSVLKATEGGPGAKEKIRQLKAAGIRARQCYTPYVGQSGIEVVSNRRRDIRRANRIIFGR